MTSTTASDPPRVEPEAAAHPARRWWQRLPFLLSATALPVAFGLYFVAVIGIGILLSDTTREDEVRGGGVALFVWWMYSFRQGDTSPWVSAVLLLIAVVFFARAARQRMRAGDRRAAAIAGATALAGVAVAGVGFVPHGYRSAELGREDALRRALAERRTRPWTDMRADRYLVERGRMRFLHTPVYYVVLYERHRTVRTTADGQPCFSRREVWRVDGLDGAVSRQTRDVAAVVDDPCLPLRIGTERDLRDVPPAESGS